MLRDALGLTRVQGGFPLSLIGVWGAYRPLATALALRFGPLAIAAIGWRAAWWWALAALSSAMAVGLRHAVPADAGPAPTAPSLPWLGQILTH